MIPRQLADTLVFPITANAHPRADAQVLRPRQALRWFSLAEAGCDAFAAILGSAIAGLLTAPATVLGLQHAAVAAAIHGALFVFTMYALKGYSPFSSLLQIRETERTMKAATLAAMLGIVCLLYVHQAPSLRCALWTVTLTTAFVTFGRQLAAPRLRALHERSHGLQRVLIYGNTVTGRRVYDLLSRSPRLGLRPTAMIDSKAPSPARLYASAYRHKHSIQVLPGPLSGELLTMHEASLVLVDPEVCTGYELDRVRAAASEVGAAVAFLPSEHGEQPHQAHYMECDGILLALPFEAPQSLFYETLKRVVDATIAATALVLFSPVIAACAVAVKLDSEGPVFFQQMRVGKDGKLFPIFKLRTMYTKLCGDALSPKKDGDPRITRMGRILRKTSLDELPQLLNVLRGEMSLVGPRPEMKMIVDGYTPAQRRRLAVTPGITGLWQISADRRFQIHDRIEYDLYYIAHRNIFLDFAVLMHTMIFAVRGI